MNINFMKLHEDAILPTKAHATDSGFDLYAVEDTKIYGRGTAVVKTGVAIDLPVGYEAQVRPRSGVTSKTKLRVQLGTIDNEYTGDVGIIVDNIDGDYAIVKKGDKLAQLVIQELPQFTTATWVDNIGDKQRGDKGFGSSGY